MAPMTPTDQKRGATADSAQDDAVVPGIDLGETTDPRGALATAWRTVSATAGALMGVVPHVLHHIGLLAGAALVTGTGGNLVFGVIGLLLSIPLLRRLHRRFKTWKAPAIATTILVAMFSLSAFVIGPAIAGDSPSDAPAPTQELPTDHTGHHI